MSSENSGNGDSAKKVLKIAVGVTIGVIVALCLFYFAVPKIYHEINMIRLR